METGLTPFWLRPLPIFIRVVGYLVILYSLLIFVAMIGITAMSIYEGGTGSFELATDFGSKYYENGNSVEPVLIRCGLILLISVLAGFIFLSGKRMAQELNEKGIAEFCSVIGLMVAFLVPFFTHSVLGHYPFVSLVVLPIEIAVYCAVRFNLNSMLKRIFVDGVIRGYR